MFAKGTCSLIMHGVAQRVCYTYLVQSIREMTNSPKLDDILSREQSQH
jgi:hypothetical protein